MISNNRTSALVSSQAPFFVRNDHPNFILFLEKYYEFLEQEDQVLNQAKNIRTFQNIDLTAEEYAERLYDAFMKYIPTNVRADKTILIKHIKDFYRAKGTEKSIRFLMNVLYKADIEFYYPKKDILRVSDGKWYIQRSLRIKDTEVAGSANTTLGALQNYLGIQVFGNTSSASALVEGIDRFYERGTQIDELILSNINGEFENGEVVYGTFYGENSEETRIESVIYGGIISSVTISVQGSGYSVGDPVLVISTVGSRACVIISGVSTGNLAGMSIVTGGAGYQNGNPIIFTGGGGGSGANAAIYELFADGTYHPNSYNIVGSTIQLEANTPIGNVTPWETFAYQNLATLWTNTSNLVLNTGSGGSVQTINLNAWKQNSNVFFETYDSLNVNGTIALITSSNIISNVITVSPGLPGNLFKNAFSIIKKPNVSSLIGNSVNYWYYSNTGPAATVRIYDPGSNYTTIPELSVVANTTIVQLGILGRMQIANGGSNYVVGDIIEFVNPPGSYGFGALANVTAVDGGGAITGVRFQQMPGQTIGGSGFIQALLPTTNVRSATGSGANIVVTAILGSGATFATQNTTLGAVEKVSILSGGEGYSIEPELDFTQSGDGRARGNATVVAGVYSYPGRYLNDDGHLSSFNFLEDRDYYQNFSYVIRSNKSINEYREPMRNLTHPAGTKLFGQYEYINDTYDDVIDLTANDSMHNTITRFSGTQEPILHLDANNSFPNTGNVWYDLSGHGNKATFTSNVVVSSNNGITFTRAANTQAIVLSNELANSLYSNVTIDVWYKIANAPTTGDYYIVSKQGGKGNGWALIQNTQVMFDFGGNTVNNRWNTGYVTSMNVWTNITVTRNNSSRVIYVNGSRYAANTNTGNLLLVNTSSAIYLGKPSWAGDSGTYSSTASVGVIRLYNRDLSANDINTNYLALKSRFAY